MPARNNPLTKAKLGAHEATRDLAADLLQSVCEMKTGRVSIVTRPIIEGRKKSISREASTGNVYADLGFADAAEMLAKARIVSQIGRIVQARKLTQAQAGELLGIDQPKVSALLRGHFKGYSQERLIGFLTKLGMDVEIVVRPKAKKRQTEGSVSVVFA